MKTVIFFSILFCLIARPVVAELTQDDLNKIRLIVKEEVKSEITASEKRIKEYVDLRFNAVDQRFKGVEQRFDDVQQRFDDVNGRIDHANNLTYALIALIIFAIGLPAWQNRRQENRAMKEITQRLEALEQQRSANP